jgi:anti-sigma-K factor RskA
MSVHEEKYLDSCAAYALGALDGAELAEFDEHLRSGCTVCAEELAGLSEVVAMMPSGLPQQALAPELKQRILYGARFAQAMKQSAQRAAAGDALRAAEAPRRSWMVYGTVVAVVVMVVAFSLSYNALLNTVTEKSTLIVAQQTQITELRDELARQEEILKVLESRRIDIVMMNGQQANPVGYGKIIWDPEKKVAILQVANLPVVPKDKDYQLWVIKKKDPGHPVSAGVFAVSADRESYFKVQPLAYAEREGIQAFAVTLEPKGGVPAPTGAMVLLGQPSVN